MENENSTEDEPVGSPAPENVKEVNRNINIHKQDHNSNVPTKNESSDDETVGPNIDTHEEIVQNAPYVKEKDQDTESSTTTKHLLDYELYEDTANDMEIRSQEDDNFSDNTTSSSVRLSNSENSINNNAGDPDIQKEDHEKGNFVNDTTLNSTATDVEIRDRVGLSKSENSINALAGEPDIQKENHETGNSVNVTILNCNAKEGEILDSVKDKEDTEQSPETIIINNESAENMEKKSNDMKTDPKDNNSSSKKEESVVLYETWEPKVEVKQAAWPEKASVLTKFVKFKSLYTISNIFSRLSRRTDENNNNSNEKDNNINSSEGDRQVEKPRWSFSGLSLIRISHHKNQENKAEVALESLELKAIKGRIVLYTKLWCKNCKEARLFLRNKKLRYSEINIDVYPSRKVELEEITGSSNVPKLFFNQVLIGGLNELKDLDQSGQLDGKIEYVISEGPSPKAPLPPFSGEDDVSSRGVVDELAVIVKKMKASIVVKDHFYKFRRVTSCFLGSEAVDFLSEDQFLEREEAIEFARKLAKELFFRHVLEENTFEDGNHLYRFLDQDPIIMQCQNIPRGIIQIKRQPLVEISHRLRFLLYAILDAYTSDNGKHIAYRSIHGSEEFARYLRIAEELQRLDLNKTANEERLAFFINLYNLMAIHGILVWGHPEGALDRRKLFNDFKYVIGGCAYSLSDIHNGIVRANQRAPYTLIKPFGITDKRFKVALPYPEPLIHFALVSGNRSDPALRCYSPKNIDMELMEAAREFLQNGAFVFHLDSMTISVTKILKWYNVDFGRNEVEVLKHAANYLEVEKKQTLLELLDSTQLKVVYQSYDWRLNS